jgi:RNA polymerase sigma factor (sigma-70 family)
MNGMTSEAQLLRASAAGSKEAFSTVVRRYQSLVCAVTYSATGDVGRSEELAQETFIRAWRNLRQLDDPSKFRAWLCTIARNLAHTSVRTSRRDAAHPLGRAVGPSVTAQAPDEVVLAKERQEIVWGAVGRIPLKYREPLVLFYRRERSVSEVAVDLGLSEDTVRQRLHRGRQLIKTEVSSLVEETLIRSGPSKTFFIAVVAALPALITPPASAAVAGVAAKGAPAAKTLIATGLTGAILGPIVGLLGGIFGSWCSIKNTKSPRERWFMIKMTILLWVLLTLLIGTPLVLMLSGATPRSSYWICFTAFFVVLVPLIFWGNAHQRKIQIADGTYEPRQYAPRRITRSGIYASFSGSIFGPTVWLLLFAGYAGDWMSIAAIIACDVLILWRATTACLRRPERYWSVVLQVVVALGALTLLFVNLRWGAWMNAYRQSSGYDSINDVSLLTIDLIVAGAYFAFALPMAWRYILHERRRTAAGQGEAN